MLKEVNELYPELKLRAGDYYFKCCMVFFIQVTITLYIIYSGLNDEDDGKYGRPSIKDVPLRIGCCYLFHL